MKKKILEYAIGPVGSGLLGLISLPLLAWFYSPEDIGRISMLQVASSFSVMLFSMGMDQAYVREYYESKNTPQLFLHSILASVLIITIVYGILFVTSPTLISDWLYGMPSGLLSALSITCFVLALLSRFLSLTLRMEERAIAFSLSQLLPRALFLLFILGSVLFTAKKNTNNLIIANTLAISATFIIFGWNTRQEWLPSLRQSFDKELFTKLAIYGLPLIIGSLSAWGLKVMDRLFLRWLSTFTELGVFSVAMSIASGATIVATIFNTIWAPLVLKWHSQGIDTKKVDVITNYVLAAVVFITIITALTSRILLYLLPAKYSAIQYLLPISLLGPLFYTLSETSAVGINISRKTIYSMTASIAAMLLNALGNYLLIPHYGALGAASSTAIAFAIFYILRTEFSCKVWRRQPRAKSYAFVLLLTFMTIMQGFHYNKSQLLYFTWLLILIFSTYTFRKELKSIKFLKSK